VLCARVPPAEVARGAPALAGAVLLASVEVGGQRLAKGLRLDPEQAQLLRDHAAAGRLAAALHLGWPEEGDVHEDEAAHRLALAAGGGGVDLVGPRQSRYDLVALWDGVLHVRTAPLLAVNAIDPLEVFTLFHGQAVTAGDTIASVKVGPHLLEGAVLREGLHVARADGPIVEVRPYLPHRVPAIVAGPVEPGTLARFEAAARTRLEALGSAFAGAAILPPGDDTAAVERAVGLLRDVASRPDTPLVLVGNVSAADPASPLCEALVALGGRFVRRGLPAHPGSMIWLAELARTRFLGLPQCGMFGLATAADLVLPRLLTGEALDAAALAELAHGGVLGREMRFRFPPYARALGEITHGDR